MTTTFTAERTTLTITREDDTLVLTLTAQGPVGWDRRRRARKAAGLFLARHPHRGPVRGDTLTPDGERTRGAW